MIYDDIYCEEDRKFTGSSILFFSTTTNEMIKIYFKNNDGFVYLRKFDCDEYGNIIEVFYDGRMDISKKNYTGLMSDRKMIEDCLDFMGCDEGIDSLVLIDKGW